MRTNYPEDLIDKWRIIGPVMTALGSVTRQKILLLFEPDEALNIKKISDQFSLSRTAVVHHLSVLQDAGILKSERIGKEVALRVDWDVVLEAMDNVKAYIEAYGIAK